MQLFHKTQESGDIEGKEGDVWKEKGNMGASGW